MASCEGLLLDPVYSGKAFAGVIGDVRSGRYPAGSSVGFDDRGGCSAVRLPKRVCAQGCPIVTAGVTPVVIGRPALDQIHFPASSITRDGDE